MPHFFLFKENAVSEITVGKTDFLEYYTSISRDMKWSNLKPHIETAFENHVGIYMKDSFYTKLKDEVNTPANADWARCVRLWKKAIALYAVHYGLPTLNLQLSDGMVSQPTTDKAQNVSQWAMKQALWNTLLNAEKSLDTAINFSSTNNTTKSFWSDGNNYSSVWISDAIELNQFVKTNGHRAFIGLKSFWIDAEFNLQQEISCDVYHNLFTNKAAPSHSVLLPFIKGYIANAALEAAIPSMLTFVEGNSVLFIHSADQITDGNGIYSKSNQENISLLLSSIKKRKSIYLSKLIGSMNADKTTFSIYQDYLDSEKDEPVFFPPSDGIGGFGIF